MSNSLRENINKALLEEARAFPLNRFLKSDGSINRHAILGLVRDFQQDALNLIFIRKSLEFHGEWFGYEKVKFQSMKQLVEIWCPDHQGYFKQIARNHLTNGCAECKGKMVERHTEAGTFIVPAYYHKHKVTSDGFVIFYNGSSELRKKI